MIEITIEDWRKEAKSRYGTDPANFKVICPMCKKISTGVEYKEVGASPDDMLKNCIGRFYDKKQSAFFTKNKKPTGCDFATYGLFKVSPIKVIFSEKKDDHSYVLDFADRPLNDQPEYQDKESQDV